MKKDANGIIWGIVLILLGVYFGGKAFGLFENLNIFFDGFWALIFIIPCFIGLFNNSSKTGNLIGIGIGVYIICASNDIIDWDMIFPLGLATILLIIGIQLLFGKGHKKEKVKYSESYTYSYDTKDAFHKEENSQFYSEKNEGSNTSQNYNQEGGKRDAYTAILSGRDIRYDNKAFHGAVISSVLGGVELDLRNAIICENVTINATVILGGIDIFVPNYARVVLNCNPILGGVDNRAVEPNPMNEKTITIYLNATCVLGGIDVK